MKALQSKIFLLTIIFASSIQNELNPDAENVCLHSETYEETVLVKVRKPVKEFVKQKCWNLRKKFSCRKEVINLKMVEEPRVVQKSRDVLKCCSGYKEMKEDVTKCVPVCPMGCVHGVCTAPDQCTCTSGFQGRACDNHLPVTTANTNPTPNSVIESTTQEMRQRKETEKKKNLSLMSEIIKITNTDMVTETTGEITKEVTFTMIDEIRDETSTTELNEKEISVEVELNITTSMTASIEEMGTDVNNNNNLNNNIQVGEEIDSRNGVSSSLKKLSTEGNEMTTNSKKFLKFEEHTVKPTEVFEKNLLVDDFTYLLYVSLVGGFLFVIALWITVKHRKRIKESQTEKQNILYLKEPILLSMENLLGNKSPRKSSESAFSMWEAETNNPESDPLGLSVCNPTESSIDMLDGKSDKDMSELPDLPVSDQSPPVNGIFI